MLLFSFSFLVALLLPLCQNGSTASASADYPFLSDDSAPITYNPHKVLVDAEISARFVDYFSRYIGEIRQIEETACFRDLAFVSSEFEKAAKNESQSFHWSADFVLGQYVSTAWKHHNTVENIYWMKNAHRCLAIGSSSQKLLFTDYYYSDMRLAENDTWLTVGHCIPRSCSEHLGEIQAVIFSQISRKIARKEDAKFVTGGQCSDNGDYRPTGLGNGSLRQCYCKLFFILKYLSPLLPLAIGYFFRVPLLVTMFDVRRNWRAMSQCPSHDAPFNCFNLMRTVSLWLIILGHTVCVLAVVYEDIPALLQSFRWNPLSVIASNYHIATDTFFLMSGTLCAYGYFVKPPSSWTMFYVRRWLRLWPNYMATLFFASKFFSQCYYYPVWSLTNPDHRCFPLLRTGVVAFLQNFTDPLCLLWTWSICTDIQWHLVAPVFLGKLKRRPRLGVALCVAAIVASSLYRAKLTLELGVGPIFIFTNTLPGYTDNLVEHYRRIYVMPHTRLGPYFVGLLLGYAVYRRSFRVPSKSWIWLALCFITWGLVWPQCAIAGYKFWLGDVVYAACGKTVWSIGWAILIYWYATCPQKSRSLKTFLNLKLWVLIANTSYSTYLCQALVAAGTIIYLPLEDSPIPKSGHLHYIGWSVMVILLSQCCAAHRYMIVEAPFANLTALFLNRFDSRKGGKPIQNGSVEKTAQNGSVQKTAQNGSVEKPMKNGYAHKCLQNGHID